MKDVNSSSGRLSPRWYLKLRLAAFGGQLLLLLLAVGYFKLDLEWPAIVALLSIIPFSHSAYLYLRSVKALQRIWAKAFITLDTLLLTGILYLSGGAANPFSIVYLVHVMLAAVILGKTWTWGIAVLSSFCFALLFAADSAPHQGMGHHGSALDVHLYGMLASYVLVAGLVSYFLGRILDELNQQEARLNALQSSQEKLQALTALAANAAHELGTPLSTIDLIANELVRSELGTSSQSERIEDLEVLSGEVARCRKIISEMCANGGLAQGEMPVRFNLHELKQHVFSELGEASKQSAWVLSGEVQEVRLPLRSMTLLLKAIVKNAIEANQAAGCREPVSVAVGASSHELTIAVSDSGQGIEAGALGSVGEPFFSTKPQGMGLGVHLSKLIAQSLKGDFAIDSKDGQGTRVSVRIPVDAYDVRRAA